jgi:hypothetical protein
LLLGQALVSSKLCADPGMHRGWWSRFIERDLSNYLNLGLTRAHQ